MQARVTAILVARSGAAFLPRTLSALEAQVRRPDTVVAVDTGSTDNTHDLLAAASPAQLVTVAGRANFGSAVARALQVAAPVESADEWLWLLAQDNAPEPRALAELLAAVEIAPSVAIAGPKLMRWDQSDVIASFGESMTDFGSSIALVDGELDQAQHDVQDDVLGVAQGGMLVRRSLWTLLGGFDPSLPNVDAALDFSVRARLAGFRVVVVPDARVATVGGPETFGRRSVTESRRLRLRRAAQLHRRLVYAPAAAVPIHWLSLVPLGIIRSIGQLLAKRPGSVAGEISTSFVAAFSGGVSPARRNLANTKRVSWAAVAPLRMPAKEVRERRAQARETSAAVGASIQVERAGFISHGGLWAVVLAGVIGLVAWGPLLAAAAVAGGGLLPLGSSPAALWANVGYGWRDIAGGFTGASDPFSYVLAVLGSITFWSPSFSIVLVYLLALPLAALGAWFAARRFTTRLWLPALAALLWAVAPPLLGSLSGGHLGAVLAHLLLPWLVLASLAARRSWASSAAAAILFAATGASAPVLVPALLLCWLALLFANPTRVVRLVGIPIPALALFAPLMVEQFARGNPLALLAEPGLPTAAAAPRGWQLALGSPTTGLHGWTAALDSLGLPATQAAVIVAALLLPIGALALLALFVPGSRRAIPSLAIALAGFATAVLATHLEVTAAGAAETGVWAAPALSLFWLGLVGGVLVALEAVGRVAIPLGVLAAVTTTIVAVPLLAGMYLDTAAVHAGTERMLPAVVTAQATGNPGVGTLVLTPQPGGVIAAAVERGAGTTLDDQSTLAATRRSLGSTGTAITTVAGNLVSRSGLDASTELEKLAIDYVVLAPAAGNAAVYQRASEALDGNPALSPVGETSSGLLWRLQHDEVTEAPHHAGNFETPIGRGILIAQAVVFGLALLLGIPTVRRRRAVVSGSAPEEPANTFDEEQDA
ncbi:MAG: glycosyltransferase family 2 protein [Microbacteriaceae bacterium]|nr:glycosyltransferase family 2 protein [Microbacteriaceae bacterium]